MPPKKQAKTVKVVEAAAKASAKAAVKATINHAPNTMQKVKGHGDYWSDLGADVGRRFGGAVGGGVKLFRAVAGHGDYSVRGNSLMHLTMDQRERSSGGSGSMQLSEMGLKFLGGNPRLSKREFVGSVVAPSNPAAFATQVYRVQPGLKGQGSLFPWLSSVAQSFQQYKLHGCILEFNSTSSDYSAGMALGTVMMSTLYDANKDPLSSEIQVKDNDYTTSNKPSCSFIHPLECKSQDSPTSVKYVRTANTEAASVDDRLDDVGIFQLSTVGLSAPAGTVLGDLYITYDIEFLKAELPDLHLGTSFVARNRNDTGDNTFNSVASPLTPSKFNSLPITVARASNNPQTAVFTIPRGYGGKYLLLWNTTSASSTQIASAGIAGYGTGITPVPLLYYPQGTVTLPYGIGAATTTAGLLAFAFIAGGDDTTTNWVQVNATFAENNSAVQQYSVVILPVDDDMPAYTTPGTGPLQSELQAAIREFYGRKPVITGGELSEHTGSMVPLQEDYARLRARAAAYAEPVAGSGQRRTSYVDVTSPDTPRPYEEERGLDQLSQSVHLPRGTTLDSLMKAVGVLSPGPLRH